MSWLDKERWIEGQIDWSESGTGPSIDHGAYSTLTEFILWKGYVKSSFSCILHFFGFWKFQNVVFWFPLLGSPLWLMIVPCSSLLPEARDGVEPSFQDLQSDTFPLCYLAKPPSSCAKVKRLFFLPSPLPLFLDMRWRAEHSRWPAAGYHRRGDNFFLPCSIFLWWLKVASHSTTS